MRIVTIVKSHGVKCCSNVGVGVGKCDLLECVVPVAGVDDFPHLGDSTAAEVVTGTFVEHLLGQNLPRRSRISDLLVVVGEPSVSHSAKQLKLQREMVSTSQKAVQGGYDLHRVAPTWASGVSAPAPL